VQKLGDSCPHGGHHHVGFLQLGLLVLFGFEVLLVSLLTIALVHGGLGLPEDGDDQVEDDERTDEQDDHLLDGAYLPVEALLHAIHVEAPALLGGRLEDGDEGVEDVVDRVLPPVEVVAKRGAPGFTVEGAEEVVLEPVHLVLIGGALGIVVGLRDEVGPTVSVAVAGGAAPAVDGLGLVHGPDPVEGDGGQTAEEVLQPGPELQTEDGEDHEDEQQEAEHVAESVQRVQHGGNQLAHGGDGVQRAKRPKKSKSPDRTDTGRGSR